MYKYATMLALLFAWVLNASAESVHYEVSGQVGAAPFTVTVDYDNAAANISNDPIFNWQTVLTVPDAVITVDYNGEHWVSSHGARLWYAVSEFDSSFKLEALADPTGLINIAEVQVTADDGSNILDPLADTIGQVSLFFGNLYLYLNDVGVYTDPNTYLDPQQTQFSKSQAAANACDAVQATINLLQQTCTNHFCEPGVQADITTAISQLQMACL